MLGLIVAFGLVFASGPAAAQATQPNWGTPLFADMDEMIPTFNENIDPDSLGFMGDQLMSERVNLVVTDGSSIATASFRITDEFHLVEFREGPRDDVTLLMITDRATVERIVEAKNPPSQFEEAVRNSDIRFEGVGSFTQQMKWSGIDMGIEAAKLFESIVDRAIDIMESIRLA